MDTGPSVRRIRPCANLLLFAGLAVGLVALFFLSCCGGRSGDPAAGHWEAALLLDNAASAFLPDIAASANGDVVAAWFQDAGDGTYRLRARRYVAGQGWGPIEPVGTDNALPVGCRIAMDASGNAFVVWIRQGSSPDHLSNVFAARCRAGAGWEPQALIGTDNAFTVSNPRIAVDRDGNALAAWVQNELSPVTTTLWARRYAAGSGWGAPERIGPEAGGSGGPGVAADGAGSWFVVWAQQEGSVGGISLGTRAWTRRYDSLGGWASPAPLDNTGALYVRDPEVAVDNAGNAVAVWSRTAFIAGLDHIWSSRYRAGDGWSAAVRVDSDDTTGAWSPSLVLDATGNAMAVWAAPITAASYARASRSAAGAGWEEWQGIGDNVLLASAPRSGVDAAGNVFAAWSRSDFPTETVWTNRYVPGAGWTGRVQIDTGAGFQMRDLRLAVSPRGDAFAVWCQTEPPAGAGHIRSARYHAATF